MNSIIFSETLLITILHTFYSAKSSVLMQYDGLEDDYWRWKKNFATESDQGTLLEIDAVKIEELCRSLVGANNYVYLKAKMRALKKKGNLKEAHLKSGTEIDTQELVVRDIIVGAKADSLKTYRCVSDTEDKHVFHLTYGYPKNYAYVVSTPTNDKDGKSSVFQAILLPSATVQEAFLKEKTKLPLLFWKDLMQTELDLKEKRESLCSLNEYQHFKVCSIVADKLHRELTSHDFGNISTMNHVHKIPHRCVKRVIMDIRGKLPNREEEVLPCAINTENWSNPQFHLLRDSVSKDSFASVYVLKTKEDGLLALFTRVDNVVPLTSEPMKQ